MIKIFKHFIIVLVLISALTFPFFVFAGETLELLKQVQEKSGYKAADEKTISVTASVVINAFLGLLGIIFIVLMIYGGYTYMTAQGDQEKIEKALSTIRRAIIGLIIIVSAYAITYFVFTALSGSSGRGGVLQY